MGKILIGASERARTESLGSMMDSYHARSVSLGTHSVICDASCQSRIVAAKRMVVLANSDLIDKLGVVLFPSILLRAPSVRFLDRTFRLLSEPGGASARDPRPSPSARRSSAFRQATQTDPGGSVLVGLAERSLERLAIQRLYHQSLDRHRLAPARLSPVLGLEGATR